MTYFGVDGVRQGGALNMEVELAAGAAVDEAGADVAAGITSELAASVGRSSGEGERVFGVGGVLDLRREAEAEVVEVELAIGLYALVGGAP